MHFNTRSFSARLGLPATLALAVFVSGCSSSSTPVVSVVSESSGKEYFSEREYGVKASPRVTNQRSRLPRGGGRDMVGKPYKVKGQWYKPKEEPGYSKVGAASWYGDAFHGRLTANGEIYDMTHLTAAHPTMPLPSYARVTNTTNGASVIVRVNDRGPFAHNRVIDLSKRAAELLDYKHAGVAKVKVEYVGRAPLHGQDDQYLMASYRPGRDGAPARPIDDGLPPGVMIAMSGDTPTAPAGNAKRGLFSRVAASPRPVAAAPVMAASVAPARAARASAPAAAPVSAEPPAWGEVLASDPVLPDIGPAVPERPYDGLWQQQPVLVASATLSYADQRIGQASQALDRAVSGGFSADDLRASWKRLNGAPEPAQGGEFVFAGSFAARAEAQRLADRLAGLGRVSVRAEDDAFSVELRSDGRHRSDMLAELARRGGAADAFLVRE